MADDWVHSICGMCTVRCPIKVNVQNGKVVFIQGNPHVPAMKGAVCPRGAAGTGLIYDSERPQTPLIREGKRGEGKWRKATWEEAFCHVVDKLNEVKDRYGAKAIALSDRGGPFRDFHRAFFRGIGTPNYNNLMDAMENGCKLTVINEIISKRFYDQKFKKRYIDGFDELSEFVIPYTPEWAAQETGVPASHLSRFVKDLAQAAPAVIWHPGWMAARYKHSFYVCRSIYIINALLGAYGAKGGLPFVSKPGDVGHSGLKKFMDLYPKPPEFENYEFKTPSKKIEIISRKLADSGLDSLAPYESPVSPEPGQFRLTFGRSALHTQGHTVNNPLLSEQMPENHLWINKHEAEKLDIEDGDRALVSQNGYSESIEARVTEAIHPDAVFVVHGFGHRLPVETRAFNKGLADNRFMAGGLDIWDRAGGAIAFQEHFVTVAKA